MYYWLSVLGIHQQGDCAQRVCNAESVSISWHRIEWLHQTVHHTCGFHAAWCQCNNLYLGYEPSSLYVHIPWFYEIFHKTTGYGTIVIVLQCLNMHLLLMHTYWQCHMIWWRTLQTWEESLNIYIMILGIKYPHVCNFMPLSKLLIAW